MIESFIEGRVRLRSPLLEDKKLADGLKDALLAIDGVFRVEVNMRTQGLLLEYDRERLPVTLLIKAVPLFERINALEKLSVLERLPALERVLYELKTLLT